MTTILEQRPLKASELPAAFELYQQQLQTFIEQAFGWDTPFQQQRFASHYALADLFWLDWQKQRAGLVCLHTTPENYHLHLLLLYPHFQGQGLGQSWLQQLHSQAAGSRRQISLSCFRTNTRALAFYQRLGYQPSSSDAHFINLSYAPAERQ